MHNNVINIFKELEKLYPNEGLINSLSDAYENRVDEFLKLKSKYDKIVDIINNDSPFEDLQQYPIERDTFTAIFQAIAEIIYDIYPYESSDFKAWYYEDEWYILHKPSGTLINWYKHCGRINTCNKTLSIAQYQEFANMFLEDINDNKGINVTKEK